MLLGCSGLNVQRVTVEPLTVNRTVYVSTTGNDNNPGTLALPFLTGARALAERQRYSTLRAKFEIVFLGTGPYTLPRVEGSICEDGGFFVIRGDASARAILITGTFTGDFSANVIGTSAGLGSDTYAFCFLRVTSGNCAGAIFSIVENTDASVTVALRASRDAMGPIVAGDTFEIFAPGTQLALASQQSLMDGCTGGRSNGLVDCGHIFFDLRMTNFPQFAFSVAAITCCRTDFLGVTGGAVKTFLRDASVLGLPAAALQGTGVWSTGSLSVAFAGNLFGPVGGQSSTTVNSSATFFMQGGRLNGTLTAATGATFACTGFNAEFFRFRNLVADGFCALEIGQSLAGKFVTTAGSSIVCKRGGLLRWLTTANWSGGTTDPAGFGVSVVGGGRAYFGAVPVLTGGTPGQDLKTTANVAANAALAAAGSSVDALGSPFAEALCRAA